MELNRRWFPQIVDYEIGIVGIYTIFLVFYAISNIFRTNFKKISGGGERCQIF